VSLPLVVQTEELDDVCRRWLAERCEVVQCPSEDPRFAGLVANAQALVVRTYTRVNPALLAGAPRLKVVGRAGVGLDNIDVPACRARGVAVVSTPDANTRAVVELVTAFMLDALRPRAFVERAMDMGEWKRTRRELMAPRQLADLTLGIVGFGRVGSSVARVGAAMNMRVVFNDLLEIPEARRSGARSVAKDELFESADVISIHVDDRAGNRGLVGAEMLSRCKPDVVFLNTSRGFVIEAPALAAFLRAHPAAQAILDVHDPEPFGPDYPLLGLKNAHLTPHIGAATATAHRNMSWVVRDVWRVLSGEKPEFAAG
jgi:phosphoglycerate dehydrogenase-like enzyme